MSNRLRAHRPTTTRRYPFVPGVLPEHTPFHLELAMKEAHEILGPHLAGTVVHVLVLDPAEGLRLIAEHFGMDAAHIIAHRMLALGRDAVPTLCCRVPFTWTTDRIVREAR